MTRRSLHSLRRRWGYAAIVAEDFTDVLATFRAVQPQLVVLDISLPFYNGFYWCAEIRRESSVPILFLSSHTENMDVVMAMNMGGDDYVTKPFAMEVLVAKVGALMRRAYGYTQEARSLSAHGAALDTLDGTLTVNINRLRKRLSGAGLEGFIQTKKGEGYIIRE